MMVSLASRRPRKSPAQNPIARRRPFRRQHRRAADDLRRIAEPSTTAVPKIAPIKNCPSAPTETRPSRAGRIVASAHSRIGAVFTSVSDSE